MSCVHTSEHPTGIGVGMRCTFSGQVRQERQTVRARRSVGCLGYQVIVRQQRPAWSRQYLSELAQGRTCG